MLCIVSLAPGSQYPERSIIFFLCSFFARPKNEPKKGAENDNFGPSLRPLHRPYWRYVPGPKFAPFSGYHRASKAEIFSQLLF